MLYVDALVERGGKWNDAMRVYGIFFTSLVARIIVELVLPPSTCVCSLYRYNYISSPKALVIPFDLL